MELRESLFWDTNPKWIDLKKNAQYVIERVLDFGRDDEVRWLRNTYDTKQIKDVVERSRCLRPETKALWNLLLQNN